MPTTARQSAESTLHHLNRQQVRIPPMVERVHKMRPWARKDLMPVGDAIMRSATSAGRHKAHSQARVESGLASPADGAYGA